MVCDCSRRTIRTVTNAPISRGLSKRAEVMNDPKKLAAAALLAGGIGLTITGTANAAPYNPPAEPPDPCFACHVEPVSAESSADSLAGSAVPVTDTVDGPFETLFGDSGFNAWTTTADTDLAALSPTLVGDLATSVDGYEVGNFNGNPDDAFTVLTDLLDPSAFSGTPFGLLVPDNTIGDFAVGLDYTLFASGIGAALDPGLDMFLSNILSGGL
jgi:hypothetical protein